MCDPNISPYIWPLTCPVRDVGIYSFHRYLGCIGFMSDIYHPKGISYQYKYIESILNLLCYSQKHVSRTGQIEIMPCPVRDKIYRSCHKLLNIGCNPYNLTFMSNLCHEILFLMYLDTYIWVQNIKSLVNLKIFQIFSLFLR